MSGSSVCRSCGRPIVWAVSALGKNTPLDPEPREDGNIVRNACVIAGRAHFTWANYSPELHKGQKRYVSHFVTCPDAKNWGRR